jgi:hypothetical protein
VNHLDFTLHEFKVRTRFSASGASLELEGFVFAGYGSISSTSS